MKWPGQPCNNNDQAFNIIIVGVGKYVWPKIEKV